MDESFYRLILAVLGFSALIVITLIATKNSRSASAGWAKGGAVALAASGFFGLLIVLGRNIH